jgi:hypothetical protein
VLLNTIVAAVVLLIAYMWTAQGFFSALLHLVCTIVAGAIAFALWEPLVYGLLLDLWPAGAWTIGLVVPFLIALGALRVAADKLIPREPKVPGALDFVGGGAMGAGSGIIAVGVLLIGMGFMPVGPDFLGHRMMDYDASGNLVKTSSLWIPADELTAEFYEQASRGAFSLGETTALATRAPDIDEQASLVRASYKGWGKTILTPDDIEVLSSYVVTAPTLEALTSDAFNAAASGELNPQEIKRTDASSYPAASVIRGYTVELGAGAYEESGQFLIGPGQARLIATLPSGESEAFQAVAVIAQASGDELSASRFRFDAKNVFVGTAGRATDPVMSFEFVVPEGAEPTDLLLKQARVPLEGDAPDAEYTVEERDQAIYSLELIGRGEEGPSGAMPQAAASSPAGSGEIPVVGGDERDSGIRVTSALQNLTLSRQDRGSLRVSEDPNLIVSGEHTFMTEDITGKRVMQELKVTGFQTPPGASLVQVDVSLGERASLLGRAMDAAERLLPPVLTDTLGQQYRAVGYIFGGGDRTTVKYEPSDPVRSMEELPSLSRSRPGDTLVLLFQVNTGVELTSFSLGGQRELLRFEPPITVRDR